MSADRIKKNRTRNGYDVQKQSGRADQPREAVMYVVLRPLPWESSRIQFTDMKCIGREIFLSCTNCMFLCVIYCGKVKRVGVQRGVRSTCIYTAGAANSLHEGPFDPWKKKKRKRKKKALCTTVG